MALLKGSQENRTLDVPAPSEALACWIDRRYIVGLHGLPGAPVVALGAGANRQRGGGTTVVNRVPLEEFDEAEMAACADYPRLVRTSTAPNSLRFLLAFQQG